MTTLVIALSFFTLWSGILLARGRRSSTSARFLANCFARLYGSLAGLSLLADLRRLVDRPQEEALAESVSGWAGDGSGVGVDSPAHPRWRGAERDTSTG